MNEEQFLESAREIPLGDVWWAKNKLERIVGRIVLFIFILPILPVMIPVIAIHILVEYWQDRKFRKSTREATK